MSVAIDTNILVRLLTRDDEAQHAKAKSFLKLNNCLVQTTVLLELEWVLRSVHGYKKEQIADVLNMLLNTNGIQIEEPTRMKKAVLGLIDGMDFADAYHLAGAADASAFATFDRDLIKRAPSIFSKPPIIQPQ